MSSILHPRGPDKAAVYWRRRALVLGIVLVLVGLIAVVVWQVVPTRGNAALPSTGGTPRACEAADIKVSLTRFKREWPDLQKPGFTGTIMNSSDTACALDVAEVASLLVVSGSDRIYSSADCPAAQPPSEQLVIEASTSKETSVVWDRTRSDAACSQNLPAPLPGTYRATWTVLGVESPQEVFVLQ